MRVSGDEANGPDEVGEQALGPACEALRVLDRVAARVADTEAPAAEVIGPKASVEAVLTRRRTTAFSLTESRICSDGERAWPQSAVP